MGMGNSHDDDDAHHTSFIDDDPLNSFLTPTPLLDDGDTDDEDADMDMDFAFDAGIENPHDPAPIVRSISPSKLASGGLPRPPSTPPRAIPVPVRTPSPRFLRPGSYSPPSRTSTPEITTPMLEEDDNEDEEEEDYVRFTPHSKSTMLPQPFHLGSSKSRMSKMRRAKAAAVAAAKAQEKEEDKIALMMLARREHPSYHDEVPAGSSLLAPSPEFHVGRPPSSGTTTTTSTRGRSTRAFGRPPMLPHQPRSWSGASGYGSGRLSPRAWREPSPDVWSIEEEEEDEIVDEESMDVHSMHDYYHPALNRESKSKKRVRFAWPVREDIP